MAGYGSLRCAGGAWSAMRWTRAAENVPELSKAVGPSLAELEGGALEPHSWERQIDIRETLANCLCT